MAEADQAQAPRPDLPLRHVRHFEGGQVMNPHWRADAACRSMPTATFFPVTNHGEDGPKAVCRDCPVRAECLDYALVNREYFGVWGGLGERERERLRKRRRLCGDGCGRPRQAGNGAMYCAECAVLRRIASHHRDRMARKWRAS